MKYFFPELDAQKLSEVEEFHRKISTIMMAQVKESEKNTWNLINLLNDQITELVNKISEISQVKNVSTVSLEKYEKINDLSADCKTQDIKLTDDTMIQAAILESKLNEKMYEVNSYIFTNGENTPHFHIKTPKSYEFFTPNDDGTGTNHKGLIVMDIATLLITYLY